MYDLTKTLDNVQEQKNKPVALQDPIFAQDILDDDELFSAIEDEPVMYPAEYDDDDDADDEPSYIMDKEFTTG